MVASPRNYSMPSKALLAKRNQPENKRSVGGNKTNQVGSLHRGKMLKAER